MLEIKGLTISLNINDKVIIDNFNFVLNSGDKAVIIGEEGNGKSSLLKLVYDPELILGYCEYGGEVVKKGRAGFLPQFFPADKLDMPVRDYFANENLGLHARVLHQLGLEPGFLDDSRPIRTLSGGEKIKIQLAKILMDEPDILLLDEPTNDIDIAALKWLEGFILGCRQPILYISHDETLIENTANVIIHIEQLVRKTKPKVTVARVGYAEYVDARGLAFDKQMMVAKKQRADHKKQMDRWRQIYERVNHEQGDISRGDPAGGRLLKKKMKSVLSTGNRLKRQADDFLDIPEVEKAILAGFDPSIHIPAKKVILDLDLPVLHIGDRELARDIRLNVAGAARVGIIGTNGVGKSTLLREIWHTLKDRKDVIPAYMPQNYREVLDYEESVLNFLCPTANKADITHARTYLGGQNFTGDEMTGKIGRLSGGQKAKILFLDMVLKKANVLVLDEPTRNFSPLSAPRIRHALSNFGGAIISISHDRKYLEEVCEKVYTLTPSGLLSLD
ncbi:MAG: ATP-binding cassette domain-containing protein [Defluviitaleaceae bacterium]|nr:ATP-binding cassette domain-containing protein [Defluviitaleaceae bacterium]